MFEGTCPGSFVPFPCLFCRAAGERGRYRTPCLQCSVSPKQEWTCSLIPSPLQHISSHPLAAAAKLVCPSSFYCLACIQRLTLHRCLMKPTLFPFAWIEALLSNTLHTRHSKHSSNKHNFCNTRKEMMIDLTKEAIIKQEHFTLL